jgi:vacuolar-type H+-ATPase subunit E/Vma4
VAVIKQASPRAGVAIGGVFDLGDLRAGAERALADARLEAARIVDEARREAERVRELVLQGRRDRVSTIYERLTREYYRRLAEEASR